MSRDIVIGDGLAQVRDLSALPPGTVVEAGEIWDGSPAKKSARGRIRAALPPIAEAGKLTRFAHACYYSVTYGADDVRPPADLPGLLCPVQPRCARQPACNDYDVSWTMLPVLAWPAAFGLVVVSMIAIIALRWAVLPRVRTGVYSMHSTFYLRKWTLSIATEVIRSKPCRASLRPSTCATGIRMMGARIGKGTEISSDLGAVTTSSISAPMDFWATNASSATKDLHRGWMTLREIKTGDRVFIGNDSGYPLDR